MERRSACWISVLESVLLTFLEHMGKTFTKYRSSRATMLFRKAISNSFSVHQLTARSSCGTSGQGGICIPFSIFVPSS
jgi:hypothetical protein